jgi:eukaryotic-like serine/threonine-protein kinase
VPETPVDQLADRYRVERELGSGGMATVYLAHDVRHDRKVALKVLKPELAAVIGAARFLAEIKTTANLQNPHILPLHDSGVIEGTVYYVMPFSVPPCQLSSCRVCFSIYLLLMAIGFIPRARSAL